MLTLEEQIERIADAAVETARSPEPGSVIATAHSGRDVRRFVGIAAGLLIAAALGGLVWLLSNRTGPTTPADQPGTPAQQKPSTLLPPNEPTVTADPNQIWLAPTWLPAGVSFEHAMFEDGFAEMQRYGDDGRDAIVIWSGASTASPIQTDEVVSLNGVDWSVQQIASDDGSTSIHMGTADFADADESALGPVEILSDLDREVLFDVIASLRPTAATELPLPPLPMTIDPDTGVIVANATVGTGTKQLLVATDGVNFAMSVDGGGGGPCRLDPGEFIVGCGAMGPTPNLLADGSEAESLVWGVVHPDVATVAIELSDGRTITAQPQDAHGFSENFFLVAVPTRTGGGTELIENLTALDGSDSELARNHGLFPEPTGNATTTDIAEPTR